MFNFRQKERKNIFEKNIILFKNYYKCLCKNTYKIILNYIIKKNVKKGQLEISSEGGV